MLSNEKIFCVLGLWTVFLTIASNLDFVVVPSSVDVTVKILLLEVSSDKKAAIRMYMECIGCTFAFTVAVQQFQEFFQVKLVHASYLYDGYDAILAFYLRLRDYYTVPKDFPKQKVML